MSGPKVVRIVTREELVENSMVLLRQLDRIIDTWTHEGQRLGVLEANEIDSTQKRRETLAAYLEDDRFAEIQQRIPEEISFLTRDIELRRERAAQFAANARLQGRQQKENAALLIRELKLRSHLNQDELLSTLEQIAAGLVRGAVAEEILANGFGKLTVQNSAPGLTDAQLDLARRLASDDDSGTFEDWKQAQTKPTDNRLQRIDRHLAELEVYLGKEIMEAFASRLQAIEAETPGPAVNMKLDAIVIDVGTAVRLLKAETALIQEARGLADELDANLVLPNDSAKTLSDEIHAAISANNIPSLTALMESGRAALSAHAQRKVAEARRAAILSGLSALGYEVREGMSTAWAEKGRIVLGKPSLPGYGVELAGAIDLDRLQVRAVAFAADRDASRDRGIETLWCKDFGKLQQMLATQGGSILIENSLAIGAMPLKSVDVPVEGTRVEQDSKIGRTH